MILEVHVPKDGVFFEGSSHEKVDDLRNAGLPSTIPRLSFGCAWCLFCQHKIETAVELKILEARHTAVNAVNHASILLTRPIWILTALSM